MAKKTGSKFGCQVYDPFCCFVKMHDEEKCCGVVRTGFMMTEPISDINDAKTTYTKTDNLQSVSLPKEVEKLKEIVGDINNISSYYVITTT